MQINTTILLKTPSVSINWSRSQHATLNFKDSIPISAFKDTQRNNMYNTLYKVIHLSVCTHTHINSNIFNFYVNTPNITNLT